MKNQKSKNRIYGITGLVMLFVVGFILGNIFQFKERKVAKVIDTVTAFTTEEKLPEKNCEAVEQLLLKKLYDEDSIDWHVHSENAEVYKDIIATGCPEHKAMYEEKLNRSLRLLSALKPDFGRSETSTCEQVEKTLLHDINCHLEDGEICGNAWTHIHDAQIYANLSERGCQSHSNMYKEKAQQRLTIARALTDDKVEVKEEEEITTKIVETYKRIQMQAEAEKMIEKAKKITGPAIDFIIQLEKIIEE